MGDDRDFLLPLAKVLFVGSLTLALYIAPGIPAVAGLPRRGHFFICILHKKSSFSIVFLL